VDEDLKDEEKTKLNHENYKKAWVENFHVFCIYIRWLDCTRDAPRLTCVSCPLWA